MDKWHTLLGRVYVGAWEVIEARSRGNETKATVVLEHLAAMALSAGAEMERFGARPTPQDGLPFDRCSDTDAGHRYVTALKQALNAAHEFDQERFEADAPASDAIQMLLGDAERQVYGPPPGYDDLLLRIEPVAEAEQPDA